MNQVKLISIKSPYTWIFLLGTLNFLGGWLLLVPGGIHNVELAGEDAASYIEAGKYLWLDFKLHYFRTFGYAIFSGLPFGFGASEELGRYLLVVFNGVLFVSTALLLYDIMHRVSNIKVYAFMLSLVYVFSPGLIFVNYTTIPESLFIFSVVIAIRFLVNYRHTKNAEDLLWFGLSLLFSAGVKPENVYFTIIICVIILVILLRFGMGLRNVFLLLLGILLMIILPILGMKKEYGVYSLTMGTKSLLYRNTCSHLASSGENRNLMYDSFMNNENQLDTVGSDSDVKKDTNWVKRDSLYSAVIKQVWVQNNPNLLEIWLNNLKENSRDSSHFISNNNTKSFFKPFADLLRKISALQNVIFSILAILLIVYTVVFTVVRLIQKKALTHYVVRLFMALQVFMYIAFGSLLYGYGDANSIIIYALVLMLINDIAFNSNSKSIHIVVDDKE